MLKNNGLPRMQQNALQLSYQIYCAIKYFLNLQVQNSNRYDIFMKNYEKN